MEDILLIGGGGHCKSVIDSIKCKDEFNIIGILDNKEKIGTFIDGIEIVGCDDDSRYFFEKGCKNAFITLGSIGDTSVREKLYDDLKDIGFRFPIIKDKTSIISKNVVIDEGTFIGKGTIVNSGTIIGKNCIINTGSILEHDCKIKDFVHIAPGVSLSGNISIEEKTHIGTNSTIIQGIKIGNNCIIGAGSVVVKNIGNFKKAYGNPCKEVL